MHGIETVQGPKLYLKSLAQMQAKILKCWSESAPASNYQGAAESVSWAEYLIAQPYLQYQSHACRRYWNEKAASTEVFSVFPGSAGNFLDSLGNTV